MEAHGCGAHAALEDHSGMFDRKALAWRVLGIGALTALMVVDAWGHWRTVAALVVVSILFQLCVSLLGTVRRARPWVRYSRFMVHALLLMLLGLAAGWSLPFGLLVILDGVVIGFSGWMSRSRILVVLATVGPVALLSGVRPEAVLATVIAVLAAFVLTDRLSQAINQMLDAADRQQKKLEGALRDLMRMQRALIQQEKLAGLGMLAAGVAHEINNPMSYVGSNVSSLLADLRRLEAPSQMLIEYRDEVLPATVDGIRRVNAIVADLRRFARAEPEEMRDYDLNQEVEAAVRIVRGQLDHCHLEVDLGELPRLRGRPQQIAQVLVNLLVNARQAISGDGRIQVTTRVEAEGVSLAVRDSGVGMNAETKRHLFEPFFTTKGVGEGTGLGLAVIHGIVQSHSGRIEVESELGRGTCFTVWLPRVVPAEEADRHPATGAWRLAEIQSRVA